jgi:DNA polymerase-3 subunit delta
MEIYLNYGEEIFLVEYNTKRKIEEYNLSNPSMNLIYLNDDNIDKLIQNCEQLPFFDEKKVIVAKNTGMFSSGNKKISSDVIEKTLEYIEKLPDYIVLIFSEDSVDKRLTAYKRISKIAKCTEYKYNNIVEIENNTKK